MTSSAITDKHVVEVLNSALVVVNPVLRVLASTDPFGLRERTKRTEPSPDTNLDTALDAIAWVLNTADVPGTKAWDEMTVDQRCRWWVARVGAVNNLIVAYPGVFGLLAKGLPIQDALGFGNQAIVLCAVAREHDVTDRHEQVRMLAAVLCHRTIPAGGEVAPDDAPHEDHRTPFALAKALWRIGRILRSIDDELAKRPRPRKLFRYVSMIPVVGVAANYLGEFGALGRAATEGQAWLAAR
ncbi:hypothetical protein [Antrihabitans sp. YC2-6]|uniref:hypothetical protein n=1 Tax=Antrihabitans sp. YC2-6 TaxID=2799498 RepID=UPI0018F4C123|nr:hypothetical protein [Antrihabitans sp. YC2-6]MBJ8343650.1 hypothetical protein [Antrihabitans sp. YC2-6]